MKKCDYLTSTDVPVDFYEVALVLGACFLVNYVTADAKTNWVEGFIMVMFYLMIVSVKSRKTLTVF